MLDVLHLKEAVTRAVELSGVMVILVGGLMATGSFLALWRATSLPHAFPEYRPHRGPAQVQQGRVVDQGQHSHDRESPVAVSRAPASGSALQPPPGSMTLDHRPLQSR
jgi:hypothetical protein